MLYKLDTYNFNTCQLLYELKNKAGEDIESSFCETISIVHGWIKAKFSRCRIPEAPGDYSINTSGIRIDELYSEKDSFYTFRSIHADNKVAGKMWTTQASLFVKDDRLLFGIKNVFSVFDNVSVDYRAFSAPAFVKEIFNRYDVYDAERSPRTCMIIKSEEELEQIYYLVTSKNRNMPVVIISETSLEKDALRYLYVIEEYGHYFLDGVRLCEDLNGLAHVVCLPKTYQEEWNRLIGMAYSVYDGAVRTYYPDFDTEDVRVYQHPIMIPQRIMSMDYTGDTGKSYIGGHAFRHILTHRIKERNMMSIFEWSKAGCDFYLERLIKRNDVLLQSQMDEKDYYKLLEEENEELRSEAENLRTEIKEYLGRTKELEEEVKRQVWINTSNQLFIRRLQAGERHVDETREPKTYDEMSEWIENRFRGRIILHNRAKKGIKSADYKDINEICDAVRCLGDDYYYMRVSGRNREDYLNRLKELHLEDLPAVSDTTIGAFPEQYTISYAGRKLKLERHIKHGNSRDTRECFRIYYVWDEETSQVIIGSMPAHLDTINS